MTLLQVLPKRQIRYAMRLPSGLNKKYWSSPFFLFSGDVNFGLVSGYSIIREFFRLFSHPIGVSGVLAVFILCSDVRQA